MNDHRRLSALLACAATMLLASAASASAAVLGVNAHDDADDGVCDVIHCSLREAINSANRTADNEEIHFIDSEPITPTTPLRAGIHAHVHPHVMRHAFGDHIARYAGIKNAQALLGHADVGTTQIYTGAPTLDELAAAIKGIRFAVEAELTFYPLETHPANPLEAPTGIEPVYTALQAAA